MKTKDENGASENGAWGYVQMLLQGADTQHNKKQTILEGLDQRKRPRGERAAVKQSAVSH